MFEPVYKPSMATEFEKLDSSCIGKKFFDRIEQINYSRFVKGLEYVRPIFNNDASVSIGGNKDKKEDMKKGDLGLKWIINDGYNTLTTKLE